MVYQDFLRWLLELNICLTLGFMVYWWLFRKQTLYQWNRLFLVIWPMICVMVASLHFRYIKEVQLPVPPEFERQDLPQMEAPIVALENPHLTPKRDDSTPFGTFLLSENMWWYVYLVGLLITLSLFAVRLKILFNLIKRGWPKIEEGYTILEHSSYLHTFSFGNYIFKNQDEEIPEMILAHELVHVHQKHSLDLLYIELLIITNWFNPVIYLYRKHLKETHEFIADQAVVQQYGLLDYVRLLVAQATQQPVPILALSFAAFTKKRIIAMKTKTTNSWSRTYYLVLIPLFIILISAFAIKPIEKIEYLPKAHWENNFHKEGEDQSHFEYTQKSINLLATEEQNLGLIFSDQKSNFILPIEKEKITKVSSEYGMRIHPILKKKQLHRGIDLVAPLGTPILAVESGEVIEANEKAYGYGKKIVIKHNNGLRTLYAQMQSISVKEGDQITQGQQIGELGSSGLSTNPHLHFEVRENKVPRNPMDYLPEIESKK